MSSSPGDAVLILSDELLDNLSSLEVEVTSWSELPWSVASGPLLSSGSQQSADTLASSELSHELWFDVPADLLGLLGVFLLEDRAALILLSVSSQELSTSPVTNELAGSPFVETELVGCALLALSQEGLDDSSLNGVSVALDVLSSGLGPDSASSSVSDESSKDFSLLVPADGSLVLSRLPD